MNETVKENRIIRHWSKHGPSILLALLLIIFLAYSIFVALNLKTGIIPDEPAHFIFSKHFSTTAGIPADVPETYSTGWYIEQNPFLYYWINGRIIDLVELVSPTASDQTLLGVLRLFNSLYSLGTILFCYLLSKEIIKNRWWQLLPVFLLTNTLMFVFLSGGVNYDNLANMFCMAGLLYLARVFNGKDFLSNSMLWMIFICLGALTKYTVLPLALFMFFAWLFFTIKNRKSIFPLPNWNWKKVVLGILLLLLLIGNGAIYGYNLVVYQSIRPHCADLLTASQCALSPYDARLEKYALDHKLTISESISQGYPDPIAYFLDTWIPHMFYRIFGILGHKFYFPYVLTTFYRLLFYWMILLAVRYGRRTSYSVYSLLAIFLLYALTLFIDNYNNELVYGFQQIAMQGRYIFPVIGTAYVLFAKLLEKVPNKPVQIVTLVVTLALFFSGGPIKLLLRYDTSFLEWFIH